MSVRNAIKFFLVGVFVACAACAPSVAQSASTSSSVTAKQVESVSGYNQPPKNILDVMLAPALPEPEVSPTQDAILLVSWQDYPSISRVATPYLRLAGVRIEPRNHSKHDTPGGYGITPCTHSFELIRLTDAAHLPVTLPAEACPGPAVWSADGRHFAFPNIATDSVELWIGEAET